MRRIQTFVVIMVLLFSFTAGARVIGAFLKIKMFDIAALQLAYMEG